MKIAVVGAGVSGLVAAWLLQDEHEVTVFEVEVRPGGHTHTVDVELDQPSKALPVDTGFIVYNERTYPQFCRLLRLLGIEGRPTDMGFSVQVERSGLEYCGKGVSGFFAQRRRILSPRHWGMLREILRFYRLAPLLLESGANPSLGEYLEEQCFGSAFIEEHLLPMAAAVWSADPGEILDFPARTLIQFFRNHGFLDLKDRPQWLTIPGGSREYVKRLLHGFRGTIACSRKVEGLRRGERFVRLRFKGGLEEQFDEVVLACHGDQALDLLESPSEREQNILSAFRFTDNDVVLHQDEQLLPTSRRSWSAWNYYLPRDGQGKATVSYWMNKLQGLESRRPLIVTLNQGRRIREASVLRRFTYAHPRFDHAAIRAQARHAEISGVDRIHYCGAYWRYGFHEDGVWSAVRVAKSLGLTESRLG